MRPTAFDVAAGVAAGVALGAARPDAWGALGLVLAAWAWARPAPAWARLAAVIAWQAGWLGWLPATLAAFGAPAPWPSTAVVVVGQALPLAAVAVAADRAHARFGAAGRFAAWTIGLWAVAWLQLVPTAPALVLVAGPLAPWVAWLGRDAAVAAVFGVAALPWRAALAGLALAVAAGRAAPPAADGALQVAIVQPNTGPMDGRRSSTAPARAAALAATVRAAHADVVVTPEGAWPLDPPWPRFAGWVVLGASPGRPPSNALVVLRDGEEVDRYEKHDLVPVTERRWAGLGRDRYRAGDGPRGITVAGARVAAWICYEDLLPGRALAGAAWAVDASNDTWLAGGAGADFHLAAARLVALETGRPVVRPTTAGTSAIIAPDGQLRAVIGPLDGDAATWPTIGVRATLPAATPRPSRAWAVPVLALALLVGARRLSSPS